MSEELLPYPFCGGNPTIHKLDDGVSIACYHDEDNKISVDDGCIHRVFVAGSNEKEAIAAWNRRV